MMATSAIVIPARYGSSRFPGKPLALIAGKTLLQRVVMVAQAAAAQIPNTTVLVATDDERILRHAEQLNVPAVMTPVDCQTGTDRVFAAVQMLATPPRFIVNLQGDAPLTPVSFLVSLLEALKNDDEVQFVTPVVPLSWQALDQLRIAKQVTPFSGTTAILDRNDNAVWFSKMIIPALRGEAKLRQQQPYSPVYQHVGLYAYRYEMLATFVGLPQTPYELLEELEQLRVLEHGYPIRVVKPAIENYYSLSGVDSVEDAQRVEAIIAQYGERLP